MPTYEYRCKCGEEFEEFQSITSEPVADCPKCGKKARRQISAGAGLIFKGSGFYITDYARSGATAGAGSNDGASKSDSSAAKSESSTKSDSVAAGASASQSAKGGEKSSGKAA